MDISCRSVLICAATALTFGLTASPATHLFAGKPVPGGGGASCQHLKTEYRANVEKARTAWQRWKTTGNKKDKDRAYYWKKEALFYKKRYQMECMGDRTPPGGDRYPGDCIPKPGERTSGCTYYGWEWQSRQGRNRECRQAWFRQKNPKECYQKCVCKRK